ncbi:DUF1345 domain-containing protein [Mucilaginibacter galii]|uniref:DUF1345 domain-containing protein n=1 Tax=Mucilaginibacter galii TaxID=2005073 RepID=A0A917J7W3_9SPHI|nr:DUF1345 domain-containing protein [Mucilaginibacter galii]GGI50368.1 hypothetical protein GCM10011425_15800 [Mucilaginibacter galii]
MPDNISQKAEKEIAFHLDAHYRLIIAIVVSLIVAFAIKSALPVTETILISWISFAFSLIIPEWITIITIHPRDLHKIATLQDSSRTFIFLFVLAGSLISLLSIAFLMKSPEHASTAQVTGHVILTISSVIISWWLVHTVFTLRYAHQYYDTNNDDGSKKPACGLEFPNEKEPDYLDFVYYSFNIGVAFQVSDINITSRKMRRLTWIHSLISFAFNTAIVALSINITSEIISKQ